jgi:hypothetical protein
MKIKVLALWVQRDMNHVCCILPDGTVASVCHVPEWEELERQPALNTWMDGMLAGQRKIESYLSVAAMRKFTPTGIVVPKEFAHLVKSEYERAEAERKAAKAKRLTKRKISMLKAGTWIQIAWPDGPDTLVLLLCHLSRDELGDVPLDCFDPINSSSRKHNRPLCSQVVAAWGTVKKPIGWLDGDNDCDDWDD